MSDDKKVYHSIGVRDAYANMAAEIHARGLCEGTRLNLMYLHHMAPDNPHIVPALELTKAAEAKLEAMA